MSEKKEHYKELTMIRTFDASRELMWKVWTDPKLVREWWDPRGVTIPICEIDARKGGRMNIVMEAGEELGPQKGQRWPMKATFDEVVVPLKKLVFTASLGIVLKNRQTITFEESGGKNKVTVNVIVTKVNKCGEIAVDGMDVGYKQLLDKFGEFLLRYKEVTL
jgi:uncharacterized protein YndB with AHSA1/START domain